MYIFLETTGGARTNICSGMLVMNKEQFLERLRNVKFEKWSGFDYRYAKLGTDTANFKNMPLDVFESIFTPEECTRIPIEFYQKHTLKAIDSKYGKRYYDSLIKPLKAVDLFPNSIYLDYNDREYIYLGLYTRTVDDEFEGKRYIFTSTVRDLSNTELEEIFYRHGYEFKTLPKLKKFVKTNPNPINLNEEKITCKLGRNTIIYEKII